MPSTVKVTLKLATSLDGRIATSRGESKWITGEAARAQGHRLRATHDAILVGIETVLADDPALTVRVGADGELLDLPEGYVPSDLEAELTQPLRVILDSRLRTSSLAEAAKLGCLIITTSEPRPVRRAQIERVEAGDDGRPSVTAVLAALDKRGIRSILIEGGGQVAASFLRAGAVDVVEWFRAPILLGGDGRPGVASLALENLASAPQFRRISVASLGDDLWERYERV
jgi:diaminohydroxyphosphoribosylaminopyrimidine deaminase/5-amino-6-(5-phosphoribosylamino)uracil reductase